MPDQQVIIRPVRQEDNPQLIELIKTVMTELGAAGEGFSIRDPEVLSMSTNYQGPSAGYYVLVRGAEVLGGAGFAALTGGEPGVCELRKMYFLPSARGLGKAQEILEIILDAARAAGYTRMYLETIDSAGPARKLYERNGFVQIACALGNTGHGGCDTFYERELI